MEVGVGVSNWDEVDGVVGGEVSAWTVLGIARPSCLPLANFGLGVLGCLWLDVEIVGTQVEVEAVEVEVVGRFKMTIFRFRMEGGTLMMILELVVAGRDMFASFCSISRVLRGFDVLIWAKIKSREDVSKKVRERDL